MLFLNNLKGCFSIGESNCDPEKESFSLNFETKNLDDWMTVLINVNVRNFRELKIRGHSIVSSDSDRFLLICEIQCPLCAKAAVAVFQG